MPVKIARGTTGQADYYTDGTNPIRNNDNSLLGDWNWNAWTVYRDPGTGSGNEWGWDSGLGEGWPPNPNANGWTFTSSGVVTVAPDAAPGYYKAVWCENRNDGNYNTLDYHYEFEVVCFQLSISSSKNGPEGD